MLPDRVKADLSAFPITQGTVMGAAEVRSVKVARIFNAFDTNSDGGLSKVSFLDEYFGQEDATQTLSLPCCSWNMCGPATGVQYSDMFGNLCH